MFAKTTPFCIKATPWRSALLVLGAVCLTLGPCVSLYAKPFPLCMYGVDNPADIAAVKEGGFNCIQTYQKEPSVLQGLAQEAAKQKIQLVFYPDKVIGSSYAQEAQNWPMLAWYLVDEPDVWNWSRDRVQQRQDAAKNAFAHHATTLVLGQGKTKISYYDLAESTMVDWYPVPHLPLNSFGQQIALAKQGIAATQTPNKPLWGVVQIFDWKEFKQYRPDNDRVGRFPTEEEIRFMSYHGILNGADGLFYFIFTTNGKPLPQAQPQWWARVAAVGRELAQFTPIVEEGKPVKNPTAVLAPLMAKTWKHKGQKYTLLLNTSDQPQPIPAKLMKKKYQPLFGVQKGPLISPHAVWILSY